MKKNYSNTLKSLFGVVVTAALLSFSAGAQVAFTQWDFEGDVITPSTGSGTASLVGGTTATFATGYTGTGTGGRAWNSAGYPAQGTASGTAGVEFMVSTSGYSGINFTWDHRHSNTSANRIRVQYTLDGSAWNDFQADATNATNTAAGIDKGFDNGRYITDAGDTWYQRSASFAGISGASNNPAFAIRIVSEFVDGSSYGAATSTSNYGPSGTWRFDNVTFLGAGSSPLLTATPGSLSGFTYVEGAGPSEMQITTLNAFNLSPSSGAISITPPANYEYSVDGVNFTTLTGNIAYENGSFPGNGNVPVRLRLIAGLPAGSYTGDFVVSGGGAPELLVPLSGSVTLSSPAALSNVILPRFIEGAAPTNTNRVPFAYYATLSNLLPSSTYRYYNKIVISTDAPDYNGAGNCIFVNASSGTFTRTSSTSMNTPGQYGEFTTDASGSYSGWFVTEPTGNATRFKPGTELFARIMLNDGAGGTTEATRLTTTESFKVLGFYTNSADTSGTAIRGVSNFDPKNFIFLYDNAAGTGRPLAGTLIETTGVDFASVGSYAQFYTDNVFGSNGAWGTIVPNVNAAGVQRIEVRSLTTGSIIGSATRDNGVWEGTDTRNPTGGTTNVLVINLTVGIQEPAINQSHIYAYGKRLTVSLTEPITGQVYIYSMIGQQLASFNLSGTHADYAVELPDGIYLVRIQSGSTSVTAKVLLN